MRKKCHICPHSCDIEEGQTGFCGARDNINGKIVCNNYGKLTSIALDPIEKKPLSRFMPNSYILSVGSYGCNLRCPFCQNHTISMANKTNAQTMAISVERLIQKALELKQEGNVGIAYTYNEPLIGYEFVFDCAKAAKQAGLINALVTNCYINQKPLWDILPYIDAMNIDLKSFYNDFYKKLKGDADTVKRNIALAYHKCHVEITTLIIPGENDSEKEMEELSQWLSGLSPDIPLHISRFFPRYGYSHKRPTPAHTIYRLRDIAKQRLKYVYTGNC